MDIPCVGAIVRGADARIVVIKRGRPPSQGLWSLPGGRIERGETPADAVRREVHEETGLQIDVGEVAGSVVLAAPRPTDRYLVTDYFATVRPGTSSRPTAGDDAVDARWVTDRELLSLELSPDLAENLAQWSVWRR